MTNLSPTRTNHKHRLQAYKKLRKFKKAKVTRKKIIDILHKQFNIPISTLYDWYRNSFKPHGRRGDVSIRPELSYLIGAVLGDGCLYKWKVTTNYIILVGDKQFTQKYAKLVSLCTNSPSRPYIDRNKNIFFVRTNNYSLYNLCKKSKNDIKFLKQTISKNGSGSPLLFVEGFFDAEGCVKIVNDKKRKLPKICLDITNTHLPYLELVKEILKNELNIHARYSTQQDTRPNRKMTYHLRIYKKEQVRVFLENINTIKLKKDKFIHVKNWLKLDDSCLQLFPNQQYSTKP